MTSFISNISTEYTFLVHDQYRYEDMVLQLHALQKNYPFATLFSCGTSTKGRTLYGLRIGSGKRRIHFNGSHHANEWITSIILMKSAELLCKLYNGTISSPFIDATNLFSSVCFDIVPMVNPDGVSLVLEPEKYSACYAEVVDYNAGELTFQRFKANCNGVDLNRNYNAGFDAYKAVSPVNTPSYSYYQGPIYESEKETQALVQLTTERDYDMVFAYHTQGEEIFWTYNNIDIPFAKSYALAFSQASGYQLSVPDDTAASGGYKDWFIETYGKPGYTIECGKGENPIDIWQVNTILEKTFPIFLLAAIPMRKKD